MLENTEKLGVQTIIKLKHNPEKANNTKHSKTNLPWFGHLLGHSANKQGGLILQCSQAHTVWRGKGSWSRIPKCLLLRLLSRN